MEEPLSLHDTTVRILEATAVYSFLFDKRTKEGGIIRNGSDILINDRRVLHSFFFVCFKF